MANIARILLIEDDPSIQAMLERSMTHYNLNLEMACSGEEGMSALARGKFDLVVLDLGLPDGDGLDFARRIRQSGDLPIIILSGRADDVDRIVGLELGADDYLGKPFNPRELQARIRAILKRSTQQGQAPTAPVGGLRRLAFDDWRLDVNRRCLIDGKGRSVGLTQGQFELLYVFLTHRGRVLTREQLLDLTRGRSLEPYDRSIDVMVSRLRRKLGDDARSQKYIRTYHGGGYIFAEG
jgi:DNA-binding response OmpR family regulator